MTAVPPVPPRVGYAATPAPSPPSPVGPSRGRLIAVAAAVAVVIAVVVGFVVLAHKDKHTEGTPVLRPIQQADKVQLDSDLRLAATAEESYLVDHGTYTSDLNAAGYRSNGSAQISVVSAGSANYCLMATNPTSQAPEYYTRAGGVSSAPCH
jgi:hypothetical protein